MCMYVQNHPRLVSQNIDFRLTPPDLPNFRVTVNTPSVILDIYRMSLLQPESEGKNVKQTVSEQLPFFRRNLYQNTEANLRTPT